MAEVCEIVRAALSLYSISGLVVAVSGGPDSVALLSALHAAGVERLFVAHVNHKLRGTESDADEQFVRDLTQKLGLPFQSVNADVAAASGGRNIEAVARKLRYRALVEIARQTGANVIATGHTADDQAETVMHRLIRGAGIGGLAGILPATRRDGVNILRPLLEIRRAALRDYLQARGVHFRIDASNSDPRFTRNRIRAELMPIVESFNPQAVERLSRLAELARRNRRMEMRRADRALTKCELPRAGSLCILDREKLAVHSLEFVRLLWRRVWRREGWPCDAMGYREWQRLAQFCRGSEAAIDLPGGIRARLLPRIVRVGPGA